MKRTILAAGILAVLLLAPPSNARADSAFDELLAAQNMPEVFIEALLAMAERDFLSHPEAKAMSREARAFFMHELAASVRSSAWPILKSRIEPIYTQHLTDQDMRDMAAFYRTPLGQKWSAAGSMAMMTDFTQLVEEMGSLGAEIGKRLGKLLKAKKYQ